MHETGLKQQRGDRQTMTKRELAIQISKETSVAQQDVLTIIQKTLDAITSALIAGTHVEFRDFGVFDVKLRKARIGRNPRKPENTVQISPRKVVKFKAGKRMRELVQNS
jgi:nucleoid DNA-binding protein